MSYNTALCAALLTSYSRQVNIEVIVQVMRKIGKASTFNSIKFDVEY